MSGIRKITCINRLSSFITIFFLARESDADRLWLCLIIGSLSGRVVGQGASEP